MLGVELFRQIAGTTPVCREKIERWDVGRDVYMICGSILHRAQEDTVVWGVGFMREGERVKRPPKAVCAVRGPLSRKMLLEQGVDCPAVYGDPALLYPRFYRPSPKKRYRLGIIPHWRDRSVPWVLMASRLPDVLVINIQSVLNKVVDQICSCEMIASSSLHGIIVADAYGVPAAWIKLSDNAFGSRSGFKFLDYFASVGREERFPLMVREDTTLGQVQGECYHRMELDLDPLWQACPLRTRFEG